MSTEATEDTKDTMLTTEKNADELVFMAIRAAEILDTTFVSQWIMVSGFGTSGHSSSHRLGCNQW